MKRGTGSQWVDGDCHLTDRRRFVKDIGKLAAAHDQGWIVIRVVSEHRSREITRRVYDALTHRGWRPDRHQRAGLSRFLTVTSISGGVLSAGADLFAEFVHLRFQAGYPRFQIV